MATNKFVYFGETVFDLTGDDVTHADLKAGVKAHDRSGAQIEGTNTNDVDSTDATAMASQVISGQTFYARGSKVEGTMTNVGKATGTISSKNESYQIPVGYHDGSGTVAIHSTERNKLIAGNIKQGVTILGVAGSYSGDGVNLQTKTVTPSKNQQTVTADSGYDALSSVTVNAIPYNESNNEFGGVTVTIG